MENDLPELQPAAEQREGSVEEPQSEADELTKLRDDYQSRLVVANLRTEAVRAGMIDLDGLRMIDVSGVRMGADDKIIGGQKLMDDMRRTKPWLFGVASSSSAAIAPASQPVRQKTALEMTDEEYAAARSAVTKYQF